ncbi:hypothetical protein ACFSND_27175 [Brevibacillus brevis]|uniref:hypothetical protein n=1 Tax=Brevibacillus brevis TaxID=1393 RepID=UPI003645A5F7
MGRVIISEFTPQEKLKLSKIVLNCVSKGEGETELDALKKAFEIAKAVLKKTNCSNVSIRVARTLEKLLSSTL